METQSLPVSQSPERISGFLYDTTIRLPELNRTTSCSGIKKRRQKLLEMEGPFAISNGFQPVFFFLIFSNLTTQIVTELEPKSIVHDLKSSALF